MGAGLVGGGTSASWLCQIPAAAAALLQLCPSWHRGLPPASARAAALLVSHLALLLQTGTPALTKPVAAELGCVTPCLVVPGGWTQRDLEYHADNIVSAKSHNAGHNCLAAEVIITAKDWPQREAFLDALRWGPAWSPACTSACCYTGCLMRCCTKPAAAQPARSQFLGPSPSCLCREDSAVPSIGPQRQVAQEWWQQACPGCPCRRRLDREPQRVPWYPGSDKRQAAFCQKFATAEAHGSDQAVRHEGVKAAPWLLQAGLSPDKVGNTFVKPRFRRLTHASQTTP